MTRIELELRRSSGGDDDASHVLGSMRVGGCPPTSFVGWVELLALLERSIETKTSDVSPTGHGQHSPGGTP